MNKIIAMWAHPRSLSTPFERMMMQRRDFKIFHEPYSYTYYVAEKRAMGASFHEDLIEHKLRSFDEATNAILSAAREKPVYFKDMAYYVICHADKAYLSNFVNTFIIRDPEPSLLSNYKMNPRFILDEAGYEAQYKFFRMAETITGKTPAVVDATDLENDPKKVIRAYCEAVGIPFIAEALTWPSKENISEFGVWKEWHVDATKSTGFEKNMEKFDITLDTDPILREYYEICLPYYKFMHKHRIGH